MSLDMEPESGVGARTERLTQLADLHRAGALTDQEYETAVARVVSGVPSSRPPNSEEHGIRESDRGTDPHSEPHSGERGGASQPEGGDVTSQLLSQRSSRLPILIAFSMVLLVLLVGSVLWFSHESGPSCGEIDAQMEAIFLHGTDSDYLKLDDLQAQSQERGCTGTSPTPFIEIGDAIAAP